MLVAQQTLDPGLGNAFDRVPLTQTELADTLGVTRFCCRAVPGLVKSCREIAGFNQTISVGGAPTESAKKTIRLMSLSDIPGRLEVQEIDSYQGGSGPPHR